MGAWWRGREEGTEGEGKEGEYEGETDRERQVGR